MEASELSLGMSSLFLPSLPLLYFRPQFPTGDKASSSPDLMLTGVKIAHQSSHGGDIDPPLGDIREIGVIDKSMIRVEHPKTNMSECVGADISLSMRAMHGFQYQR